jgi:hypothetical protein
MLLIGEVFIQTSEEDATECTFLVICLWLYASICVHIRMLIYVYRYTNVYIDMYMYILRSCYLLWSVHTNIRGGCG